MNLVKNQKLVIYSLLFVVVNMLWGCSMNFLDTMSHACTQDPVTDRYGYQACMERQREWAEDKKLQREDDAYTNRQRKDDEAADDYMNEYMDIKNSATSELYMAIHNGATERAIELILTGADVNKRTQMSRRTPLHIAAKKGNIKVVKALLSSGAKINAQDRKGRTPLSITHSAQIIELLKSKGAKR